MCAGSAGLNNLEMLGRIDTQWSRGRARGVWGMVDSSIWKSPLSECFVTLESCAMDDEQVRARYIGPR